MQSVWKSDYEKLARQQELQRRVEDNLVLGTKVSQGNNQKEVSIIVPVLKKFIILFLGAKVCGTERRKAGD